MKSSLPLLLALLISLPAFAGTENGSRRPDKLKVVDVSIEAKVTAINHATRELTLSGADGEMVTLEAGPEVQRFHEIEVGDTVKAVYKTMFKAEFRDPTPAEQETPLLVLAEGEIASLVENPGAYVGGIVKAVVTIKHIVLDSGLVTIKGPQGNYLTIPVEDKALLKDLEVGEVAILTYAEAVAITLDKTAVK